MDFVENGSFGASAARSSVWCSPAGAFFIRKTIFVIKSVIVLHFAMILNQNGPTLLLTRPARVILACTQLLMQLPMLMHVHCKSCLTFGAKSKLPQLKVCPILAALKIKPCAAHNLSQCISARSAEKIWP